MTFLHWLFLRKIYELKIVFATLAILIALPIVSVVVVAQSGLTIVSNALATLNPITHLVEIFDADGKKVSEVELSTVWPARGYISDEFGTLSTFRKLLGLGGHRGIDIANSFSKEGDPVTPFMVGRVIKSHDVDDSACGKYVKVQHEHHVTSLYCHLSKAMAAEQQEVKPGDVIGLMGSTGVSTGPHLHFQIEVYDIPVNPRTFMVGEPEGSILNNVLNITY